MSLKKIGEIDFGESKATVVEGELKPCGECKACCTAVGVVEISKQNYQRCRHLCGAGCNVYESKPKSCGEYQCWYTQGLIEDRPDKNGLIVDYKPVPLPGLIRVWEVREGALKSRRGKRLVSDLLQYHSEIALIDRKETRLLRSRQVVPTAKEVFVDQIDETELVQVQDAVIDFVERLKEKGTDK